MRKITCLVALVAILANNPAQADILIGAYGPMTGPVASIGELVAPGIQMAVTDINAKGGVNGQQLKLEVLDDQCDPKQAVTAANKFVAMKAAVVIAFTCSGATKPAADVFEQEGVPHLVSLASNPDLTKRGLKTIFRPAIRDDNDAGAAADFVVRHFFNKKIGVIHDNTVWAKGQADVFSAGLKAHKITKKLYYELNPRDQDFSALISRLKQDGIELLYVSLYMREGGLLLRQIAEQSFKPVIVGTVLFNMPDFQAIARSAADGSYMTRPIFNDKATNNLRLRLKLPEEGMNAYAYQGYAAVEIAAQTMAKHGLKPADVLAGLRQDSFDTVLGTIKFNTKGDMNDPAFKMLMLKDGKGIEPVFDTPKGQ